MSNQNSKQNEALMEVNSEIVEHHILMGKALNALRKDPNFKLVIEDGYLKEKVLASVSLLAVPAISEQHRRPGVMEDLISASNLQYFFQTVDQFYEAAVDPVYNDEELAELEASDQGH
jgi:hypothetical protein